MLHVDKPIVRHSSSFVSSKLDGAHLDRTDVNNAKIVTVVATRGRGAEISEEISYADTKVIGNGSFGVVYQARLVHSNEQVAIKKVLQDKRFKVNIDRFVFLRHHHPVCLQSRIANYKSCDDWTIKISFN